MGKWLEALVVGVWAIFAPIHAAIIVSGVFIVADMITGIMAARKRGEKVTSAGLRRTLTKFFVYEIALVLAFLGQKYLLSDIFPACKVVSGMVGIVELKSIFENLNELSGQDLLKMVLEKLNSVNVSKK